MTNGQKIMQMFPNGDFQSKETEGDWWEEVHLGKVCYEIDYQSIYFDEDWWNEEYKEPKQNMFDYLTAVAKGMLEGERIADANWIKAIKDIKAELEKGN